MTKYTPSPEEMADADGRMNEAEKASTQHRAELTPEEFELIKQCELTFREAHVGGGNILRVSSEVTGYSFLPMIWVVRLMIIK